MQYEIVAVFSQGFPKVQFSFTITDIDMLPIHFVCTYFL